MAQSDADTPRALKALSLNSSSILYVWEAPPGATDTLFAGYRVSWGSGQDTLPRTALTYTVDSLGNGDLLFTVSSRRTGGQTGGSSSIRWAPAERFGAAFVLTEEYLQDDPLRICGLDAGGSQSDPQGLPHDPGSGDIRARMDFYLYGGQGEIVDPLMLRSASLLGAGWNTTHFSTTRHTSFSLDLPLAAFPGETTFIETSVAVQENTIYYARITGDQGGTNFLRIHVGAISGSGRARSIPITLSLQRVVGLGYAGAPCAAAAPRCG